MRSPPADIDLSHLQSPHRRAGTVHARCIFFVKTRVSVAWALLIMYINDVAFCPSFELLHHLRRLSTSYTSDTIV